MSKIIRCDAPDCGEDIDVSTPVAIVAGVRSITLERAHDWNYQDEEHLIGGWSAWMWGGTPTFHACSDEHLAAILKAAPPGALVVAFNRLEVKAAALAAVLHVMAEAVAEDEAATA